MERDERDERVKRAKPFTLDWWLLMKDQAMYQVDYFELMTDGEYEIGE